MEGGISKKQLRSLETRVEDYKERSVPIKELGSTLVEADEVYRRIAEQRSREEVSWLNGGLILDSLERRIEDIIVQLESAFDGDNLDESWLIQEGKVRIPEDQW